ALKFGRGGVEVRSRLQDQRVPGTKPDSTKNVGLLHVISDIECQKSSHY
ncbi:hypothetical protein AVEN_18477-1, partial [Araneus ventricosus]